jgi:long-chain acyl-CoA synthetase
MNTNLAGFDKIPQTLPHYCFESFAVMTKRTHWHLRPATPWAYIRGTDAIERVKSIAMGLAAYGVKAGDRVAIISENRPEWSLVDLAILAVRGRERPDLHHTGRRAGPVHSREFRGEDALHLGTETVAARRAGSSKRRAA